MLTIEIFIIILLILVFAIVGFVCLTKEEPMAALFCGIFVIIMLLILCIDVIKLKEIEEEEKEDNVVSAVVYDVKEFQIDTNVVVTGTDTTKTYTITYWN